MKTFTDSKFSELLIKYRSLSTEEAFLFFDEIFNKKDFFLNNPKYFPILFNAFFDDALDLSYMAEILEIIRECKSKISNEFYIEEILFKVGLFIPHANYWYSLLLMDIVIIDNIKIITKKMELINSEVKLILIQELKKLQIDEDWGNDELLKGLINNILQSI